MPRRHKLAKKHSVGRLFGQFDPNNGERLLDKWFVFDPVPHVFFDTMSTSLVIG
jgi:hypothetical protein